jgi:hypothetical protein
MEIFRKKNEAAIICFPMVTTASPDTFDTGETVTDTAYYSDAEGTFTTLAITDTVSEIGSTGMYEISLTAGEMNHDLIIIKFTSTNAADSAVIIRTRAVDLDDIVRATTPANTLDVDASGEVTVAGHTAQTGDTYALANGAQGFAAIDSVVDSIQSEIGLAGAGLTDLGASGNNWNTVVPPTVNQILDETLTSHVTADSVAVALKDVLADTANIQPTIATNLDAAISTRMATYTQPTGFLAATFPGGTIANTTNITAGTIATVTTLTNLPAITSNWLTATGLDTTAVQEIADAVLPPTNTAMNDIPILFVAASDHVTPVTGATGTAVTRSIDGGAFGSATGTLAEIGNGIYQFDASQADMNGTIITFRFTASGGTPGAPDDVFLTIRTGG